MEKVSGGSADPKSRILIVLTDTSVLINFLVLDLVARLVQLSKYEFWITNHVFAEVSDHYEDQATRLRIALELGQLQEISVNDLSEVELFARLTALGLGVGECSAIAVALSRGHGIAIDDKIAIKKLREFSTSVVVRTTGDIVISMIEQGILTIHEADQIKSEWEMHHRFKLPFASFSEKVADANNPSS